MHQITYSLLVVALALAASVGMLQEVGGGGCHERIYAQEIAAFCSSDDDPTPVCCHILGQVMTTEIGLTCAKSVARRPELRNIGLTFASLRDKYKKCISDDVSEDGYSMESDANSAASTVSLPRPVSITCVDPLPQPILQSPPVTLAQPQLQLQPQSSSWIDQLTDQLVHEG